MEINISKHRLVPFGLFNWRHWNNIIFSNYWRRLAGSSDNGLAIVNGLLTSILLETLILMRSLAFASAIKTAAGMSLISMLGMEVAMNLTDFMITGGAVITWWVLPYILLAGFISPLPYNYWRLKALGVACH